jgi:hypothetical protein
MAAAPPHAQKRVSRQQALLFGDMLSRQGASVLRLAISSGGRQFLVAMRQCATCPSFARCQSWLESGAAEGYETFCPNAGFVSHLKSLAS